MKPTSGRTHRSAALAAALMLGLALGTLPNSAALAQTSKATADDTPQIDASIAGQDWRNALNELDARIAAKPHDAQAKFKRGTVLARLGRDDDAIAQFVELTQSYPELPEPYNNLAALYAKHGRYDEARAALETAVKASPGYGLAYENLGDLYLRLAAESYKRAQSLGHTSGATAQRLADIQRIVSAAPAKRTNPSKTSTQQGGSNTMPVPPASASPYGGPTGSLAVPPYVAPAK